MDINKCTHLNKIFSSGRLLVLSTSIVGLLVSGCAVVSLNKKDTSHKPSGPSAYVNTIWSSKVIPYMNHNAKNVQVVMPALSGNVNNAGKKYGMDNNGSGWMFIVKGTGKVVSYDQNSGNGLATVQIDANSSKYKMQMQTGPIIEGTTVRDSLTFVKYGSFENQIQFAQVAEDFNKKVDKQVLEQYKFNKMINDEVSFVGVLSMTPGSSEWTLTPVAVSKG